MEPFERSSAVSEAQSIVRWSETIGTAERLCLLATDTLNTVGSFIGNAGAIGFPPSLNERTSELKFAGHPTTSSQCVAALQTILGELDSIRTDIGSLSFTRIGLPERTLSTDELQTQIRSTLGKHLPALGGTSGEEPLKRLSSIEFGTLNPLTCAQALRALTPSEFFLRPVWWWALFGVIEALSRRSPSSDAGSGASMRDGQPTAYVTSMCIEAVNDILALLNQRWLRLRRLMDLISDLKSIDEMDDGYSFATDNALVAGTCDRRYVLNMLIHEGLTEITAGTALKSVWGTWKDGAELDKGTITADALANSFGVAVQSDAVRTEREKVPKEMNEALDEINAEFVAPTGDLVKLLAERGSNSVAVPEVQLNELDTHLRRRDSESRPYGASEWLTAVESAKNMLGHAGLSGGPARDQLLKYWSAQHEASRSAWGLCWDLATYLCGVLKAYEECHAGSTAADMLKSLEKAAGGLDAIDKAVRDAVCPAVRWAHSTMTHHMAHFNSGRSAQFDPGELALSAQTIVRSGMPYDVNTIFAALDIVVKEQRPDGTWPAQQPIVWRESGVAAYAHSIQVATAVASTMSFLIGDGEVFASRSTRILPRLGVLEESLRRIVDWLAGTVQLVRWPSAVAARVSENKGASTAVGWCSDRGFEEVRIDLSVTANVVEFLLEFRRYCQARINIGLTELFTAYDPQGLDGLTKVKATDLDVPESQRLLSKLCAIVAAHRQRQMSRVSLDQEKASPADVVICSMILSGPPGTSKTTLAKAVARELGRPLVVLTPSDFLAQGEQNIEARAREIFRCLSLGQRMVYLFDEVDELLLSREYQQKESERSVFSFLTPSFLTKLQDLRDVAERNSLLFIIGTNFVERIDPAARRRGRIDHEFSVLYPDRLARIAIVADSMRSWVKREKDPIKRAKRKAEGADLVLRFGKEIGKATGSFSYHGVRSVWSCLVEEKTDELRQKLLQDVAQGKHTHLRPEIELSLYSGRPGAVREFLSVLSLCRETLDDSRIKQGIEAFWESLGGAQAFWRPKVEEALTAANIVDLAWVKHALAPRGVLPGSHALEAKEVNGGRPVEETSALP